MGDVCVCLVGEPDHSQNLMPSKFEQDHLRIFNKRQL